MSELVALVPYPQLPTLLLFASGSGSTLGGWSDLCVGVFTWSFNFLGNAGSVGTSSKPGYTYVVSVALSAYVHAA